MKKFIEAGKIVGTHGVRGMVRVQPWCDSGEFLCRFKKIYFDGGKTPVDVLRTAPNGNVVIMALSGVDSVEKAQSLRGRVIFLAREDIHLKEGQYLVSDIIGCRVYDIQDGSLLGQVCDVSSTGANDVWHIMRDGKEYLIPKISDVVKTVDTENERIEIFVMKGLFDGED